MNEDLLAIIVYSVSGLAELVALIYCEYKFFKDGRPAFYQLILCALITSELSFIYDTIEYYVFDEWWDGFTLSGAAAMGSAILLIGGTIEMFTFLKEKGLDCTLKSGFKIKAVALALIPAIFEVALLIYSISLEIFLEDKVELILALVTILCRIIATYLAGLVIFRKDVDAGLVKSLKLAAFGIVLYNIFAITLWVTALLSDAIYVTNVAIANLCGAFIAIGLERGSKKWI